MRITDGWLARRISLLVLVAGIPNSSNAQCASSRVARIDPTHPCEFLRISEVEKRDTTWLLFGRRVSDGLGFDSVNTSKEVDVRSKLHLGYRDLDFPLGLSVGIEAFLRHDKKEVPIEVPGYSMLGEEKKHARLRTVSPLEMRNRLEVLSRAKIALDDALAKANETKELVQKNKEARKKIMDSLSASKTQIDTLARDSLTKAYTLERLTVQGDSQSVDALAEDRKRLEQVSEKLAAQRKRFFELSLSASAVTDAAALIEVSDKKTLEGLLDIIKSQYQANAVSRTLRDPSNRALLVIMSSVTRVPLEVLTSDLTSLEKSFAAIDSLRPNADLETLRPVLAKHASAMSTAIADLARNNSGYERGNPDYDAAVTSLLPSTDIALFANNAEEGDRVVIRVTTVDLHDNRRVIDFAVDVVEYGIVRKVTDSFLFLRRHLPDHLERDLIKARAREYLRKTGLEKDLLSPVVDIPIGDDLTPTAGVTYGWTWHPRESKNPIRKWGRALHPGWGVNVSFPSYSIKQVTLVPPASDADSISAAGIEPTSKETDKHLAMSLGGVASLFDGAFQLTGGRILNVPSHKWYWGLGLSFIGLTTAGKELYEKLTSK